MLFDWLRCVLFHRKFHTRYHTKWPTTMTGRCTKCDRYWVELR